jgi:hypothetical protein
VHMLAPPCREIFRQFAWRVASNGRGTSPPVALLLNSSCHNGKLLVVGLDANLRRALSASLTDPHQISYNQAVTVPRVRLLRRSNGHAIFVDREEA